MSCNNSNCIGAFSVVLALAASIASPVTSAQEVHVVTPFDGIQAVANSAGDGAILMVQPGIYRGFELINRSLTIVADLRDPTVAVFIETTDGVGIRVHNVPAGGAVVFEGLDIIWNHSGSAAIELLGCSGDVHIRNCRISADGVAMEAVAMGAIDVRGVRSLRLSEVTVNSLREVRAQHPAAAVIDDGMPALSLWWSRAIIDRCVLRGFDHPADGRGRAGPALRAIETCTVRVFNHAEARAMSLRGGDGGAFGGDAVQLVHPQLVDLRVVGLVEVAPGPGGGELAHAGDRGVTEMSASRRLPIDPPAALAVTRIERMNSMGDPDPLRIGRIAPMNVQMFAGTNRAWFALLSPGRAGLTAIPTIDGLCILDLGAVALIGAGRAAPGAPGSMEIGIPFDLTLAGSCWSIQALFVGVPELGLEATLGDGEPIAIYR